MLVDRQKFTQTMVELELLDQMNDLHHHDIVDENKFNTNCDYNSKKVERKILFRLYF